MATFLTLPGGADPFEMPATTDELRLSEQMAKAIADGQQVSLFTAAGERLVINGKALPWFTVHKVDPKPLPVPSRIR